MRRRSDRPTKPTFASLPAAMRRETGKLALLNVITLYASLALFALLLARPPRFALGPWVIGQAFLVCGATAIASGAVLAWRGRRLAKRAKEHAFLLCTECGHRLPPSVHAGTCQECGTPYVARDVVRTWRAACGERAG